MNLSNITEQEHEQRMTLYLQGLSDCKIADILGTTASIICKWRHEHHLDPNRRRRNREDNCIAVERVERKKNMDAIKADNLAAKALGLSYGKYMERRAQNG